MYQRPLFVFFRKSQLALLIMATKVCSKLFSVPFAASLQTHADFGCLRVVHATIERGF